MPPSGLSDELWAATCGAEPDHTAAIGYYPAEVRSAAATAMALTCELRGVPARVSEPMLGAIRLQWWRDALAEIEAGDTPRAHPLVQAVAQNLWPTVLIRAPFQRMIDETSRFLTMDEMAGLSAAVASSEVHDGGLAHILTILAGERDRADAVRRAGAAFGMCRSGQAQIGRATEVERVDLRIARQAHDIPVSERRSALVDALEGFTPFPPNLAPVLAVLKSGVLYCGRQSGPNALERRLFQFAAVFRGK